MPSPLLAATERSTMTVTGALPVAVTDDIPTFVLLAATLSAIVTFNIGANTAEPWITIPLWLLDASTRSNAAATVAELVGTR